MAIVFFAWKMAIHLLFSCSTAPYQFTETESKKMLKISAVASFCHYEASWPVDTLVRRATCQYSDTLSSSSLPHCLLSILNAITVAATEYGLSFNHLGFFDGFSHFFGSTSGHLDGIAPGESVGVWIKRLDMRQLSNAVEWRAVVRRSVLLVLATHPSPGRHYRYPSWGSGPWNRPKPRVIWTSAKSRSQSPGYPLEQNQILDTNSLLSLRHT